MSWDSLVFSIVGLEFAFLTIWLIMEKWYYAEEFNNEVKTIG